MNKEIERPRDWSAHNQWFDPRIHTGWEKDMGERKRRKLVLKASKGDKLANGRGMIALANVTTDKETKQKAFSI